MHVFSTSFSAPKYSVQSCVSLLFWLARQNSLFIGQMLPDCSLKSTPSSPSLSAQVTQAWLVTVVPSLYPRPFTHSDWSVWRTTKAGRTKANFRRFSGTIGKKRVCLPSKADKLKARSHRPPLGQAEWRNGGEGLRPSFRTVEQVIHWGQQLVFPRLFGYISQ